MEFVSAIQSALRRGIEPESIKLDDLALSTFDNYFRPLEKKKNILPRATERRGLHMEKKYVDLARDFELVLKFIQLIRKDTENNTTVDSKKKAA